jgi:hypothetical protein
VESERIVRLTSTFFNWALFSYPPRTCADSLFHNILIILLTSACGNPLPALPRPKKRKPSVGSLDPFLGFLTLVGGGGGSIEPLLLTWPSEPAEDAGVSSLLPPLPLPRFKLSSPELALPLELETVVSAMIASKPGTGSPAAMALSFVRSV